MYLKSIEVQGFKSFANKIKFDFQEQRIANRLVMPQLQLRLIMKTINFRLIMKKLQ